VSEIAGACKLLTGNELMALIKNLHAAGQTLVWTVPEPKVRIEGSVAWITYLNRGTALAHIARFRSAHAPARERLSTLTRLALRGRQVLL
jgi:hypothetical protein